MNRYARAVIASIAVVGLAAAVTFAQTADRPDAAAKRATRKAKAKDEKSAKPQEPARLPADLTFIKDVVYKEAGGQKLDLWVVVPKEKKFEKAPLLVFIHGGGWGGGDKFVFLKQTALPVIRSLSEQGFVCATIEYRLTDVGKSTAMESVADCLDAVSFLAANADKFGVDTTKVGVFGTSAGGHLSLMTALANPADYPCDPAFSPTRVKLKCGVAYYPSVSMNDPKLMEGSNFARPERMLPILGGLREEKPQNAYLLSPIELLKADSPPLLLIHGDQDKTLSVKHTEAFVAKAKALKAPAEAVIVRGGGHGFSGSEIDPSMDEISKRTTAFIVEHLK